MEKGISVYILFISQECLWPVEQMTTVGGGAQTGKEDSIPALEIL